MNTYEITYHSCSSTGRRVGALRYHTITADSAISARFAFEDRFGSGQRSVQIVEVAEKPVVASAGPGQIRPVRFCSGLRGDVAAPVDHRHLSTGASFGMSRMSD